MPKTPRQAFLLAVAAVAVVDGLDAVVFWALRGVSPQRLFQAIAAGLLGRDAFAGGWPTAVLGLVLHVVVATGVVAAFFLASRRIAWLTRRPWLAGALYGLAVYAVMSYAVIPLSASPRAASTPLPVLLNGLAIHVVGVGWPTALFARLARRLEEATGRPGAGAPIGAP